MAYLVQKRTKLEAGGENVRRSLKGLGEFNLMSPTVGVGLFAALGVVVLALWLMTRNGR